VKTDIDARWAVSPDVRATYSEDGAVLLDINKGVCYSLSPVASRIWLTIESCPSGITLDGIVVHSGPITGLPISNCLRTPKNVWTACVSWVLPIVTAGRRVRRRRRRSQRPQLSFKRPTFN